MITIDRYTTAETHKSLKSLENELRTKGFGGLATQGQAESFLPELPPPAFPTLPLETISEVFESGVFTLQPGRHVAVWKHPEGTELPTERRLRLEAEARLATARMELEKLQTALGAAHERGELVLERVHDLQSTLGRIEDRNRPLAEQ